MTVTAKPGGTDPRIDAAAQNDHGHVPEPSDAGNSDSWAEARNGAAFWQGAVAPIAALLPPGVTPTRLRQMPVTNRRAYVSAVRGEASPRTAIKAFCSECCGYDRTAVATCPASACPLWRYRPWQSDATEAETDAALASEEPTP